MKRTVVIALLMLLTSGVIYAKGYELQKKAGEYEVTVVIDRNPPIAGDNAISISVKDISGKLVKDVQVKVEYSMPAMPGMPAMNYKTDAVLQSDEYKASMGLSMSGSWNVTVKITKAGKTSSMKFTVDAK